MSCPCHCPCLGFRVLFVSADVTLFPGEGQGLSDGVYL